MGCAVGTVKFSIFIFNFLLVCLGFAMVLLVVMDSPLPTEMSRVKDSISALSTFSRIFMIVGAVIFVVAFFGCWGAVADSPCMLFVYATFLMILILAEAGVGVYGFYKFSKDKDNTERDIETQLKIFMKDYTNSKENTKIAVDILQSRFHCCGVNSFKDWYDFQQGSPQPTIPTSCCDSSEPKAVCTENRAFKKGCFVELKEAIYNNGKKLSYILAGIFGVEIITIVLVLMVRNSILADNRYSY